MNEISIQFNMNEISCYTSNSTLIIDDYAVTAQNEPAGKNEPVFFYSFFSFDHQHCMVRLLMSSLSLPGDDFHLLRCPPPRYVNRRKSLSRGTPGLINSRYYSFFPSTPGIDPKHITTTPRAHYEPVFFAILLFRKLIYV